LNKVNYRPSRFGLWLPEPILWKVCATNDKESCLYSFVVLIKESLLLFRYVHQLFEDEQIVQNGFIKIPRGKIGTNFAE